MCNVTMVERHSVPPQYTLLRVNTHLYEKRDVKIKLQEIIKVQFTDRNWKVPTVEDHPLLADVLIVPCINSCEGLVPESKELIVDAACGIAALRGAEIYAPGVMAAPLSLQVDEVVAVYADVAKTCRKGWTKTHEDKKYFVGNGIARMSRQELFSANSKVCGVAVTMIRPLYEMPCLNGVLTDAIFLQNLPSIVCSHVLQPQPGECVLDMCAAPGGKTTHIACLMKNRGTVIALDKSSSKVEKVAANAKMCSLSCIKTFRYDATKAVNAKLDIVSIDMEHGPPFPKETFDRVLLDAPCSGLGQRPRFHKSLSSHVLQSYPNLQRQLFAVAAALVKVGGTLVYSTCTTTLSENELLVDWALKTFSNLELTQQNPHIGLPGRDGTGLTEEQLKLLQRFDENDIRTDYDHDTIGFFIAKFQKKCT